MSPCEAAVRTKDFMLPTLSMHPKNLLNRKGPSLMPTTVNAIPAAKMRKKRNGCRGLWRGEAVKSSAKRKCHQRPCDDELHLYLLSLLLSSLGYCARHAKQNSFILPKQFLTSKPPPRHATYPYLPSCRWGNNRNTSMSKLLR